MMCYVLCQRHTKSVSCKFHMYRILIRIELYEFHQHDHIIRLAARGTDSDETKRPWTMLVPSSGFLRDLFIFFFSRHKSKKHKAESAVPQITASPSINNSADIIQKFLMALKCWELLHASDFLEKGKYNLMHTFFFIISPLLKGHR